MSTRKDTFTRTDGLSVTKEVYPPTIGSTARRSPSKGVTNKRHLQSRDQESQLRSLIEQYDLPNILDNHFDNVWVLKVSMVSMMVMIVIAHSFPFLNTIRRFNEASPITRASHIGSTLLTYVGHGMATYGILRQMWQPVMVGASISLAGLFLLVVRYAIRYGIADFFSTFQHSILISTDLTTILLLLAISCQWWSHCSGRKIQSVDRSAPGNPDINRQAN